jgi:hypothetical protein
MVEKKMFVRSESCKTLPKINIFIVDIAQNENCKDEGNIKGIFKSRSSSIVETYLAVIKLRSNKEVLRDLTILAISSKYVHIKQILA